MVVGKDADASVPVNVPDTSEMPLCVRCIEPCTRIPTWVSSNRMLPVPSVADSIVPSQRPERSAVGDVGGFASQALPTANVRTSRATPRRFTMQSPQACVAGRGLKPDSQASRGHLLRLNCEIFFRETVPFG